MPALQGGWASAVGRRRQDLAVTPTGATGSGHLRMARLEDLAPLLGTPLAGALDLADRDRAGRRRQGQDRAARRRLRSGTTGVGSSAARRRRSTDPLGAAAVDATIKADRLSGVAEISRVNATVKGDRTAIDLTLSGDRRASPTPASPRRSNRQDDEIRGRRCRRFDGRYQGIPVALGGAGAREGRGRACRRSIRRRSGWAAGGLRSRRRDRSGGQRPHARHRSPAAQPGRGLRAGQRRRGHPAGQGARDRRRWPHRACRRPIRRTACASSGRRRRCCRRSPCRARAALVGQQATVDARVTAGGATNLAVKGRATLATRQRSARRHRRAERRP